MPGISSYKFIAGLIKSEVSTVCRHSYKFVATSRQQIKIKTAYLAYKNFFFVGNMIFLRFFLHNMRFGDVLFTYGAQVQMIAHSKEEECRKAKVLCKCTIQFEMFACNISSRTLTACHSDRIDVGACELYYFYLSTR